MSSAAAGPNDPASSLSLAIKSIVDSLDKYFGAGFVNETLLSAFNSILASSEASSLQVTINTFIAESSSSKIYMPSTPMSRNTFITRHRSLLWGRLTPLQHRIQRLGGTSTIRRQNSFSSSTPTSARLQTRYQTIDDEDLVSSSSSSSSPSSPTSISPSKRKCSLYPTQNNPSSLIASPCRGANEISEFDAPESPCRSKLQRTALLNTPSSKAADVLTKLRISSSSPLIQFQQKTHIQQKGVGTPSKLAAGQFMGESPQISYRYSSPALPLDAGNIFDPFDAIKDEARRRALEGLNWLQKWEVFRVISASDCLTWDKITVSDLEKVLELRPRQIVPFLESRTGTKNVAKLSNPSRQNDPNLALIYMVDVHYDLNSNQIQLKLLCPRYQPSFRISRRYGADKLLVVHFDNVPYTHRQIVKQKLYSMRFLQRRYSFLASKRSDRAYYIATLGFDNLIYPTLSEVVRWHIPVVPENRKMTLAKYASRFDLAFSKTVPTIAFKTSELKFIDDVRSPINKSVMTDGCGLISDAALQEIQRVYEDVAGLRLNGKRCLVFQARIASAKGVFILDPTTKGCNKTRSISIRDSQNKFHLPQPDQDQLVFEAVKPAQCLPGFINRQLIAVLAAGGVPVDVFGRLMGEAIEELKSVFMGSDMAKIFHTIERYRLAWSNPYSTRSRKEYGLEVNEGVTVFSREDETQIEIVRQMIAAGFDRTNFYLDDLIRKCFSIFIEPLRTKSRFNIPNARRLLIIPDPTNTLREDEVFIQINDQRDKNGDHIGVLRGPVLLGRNPCVLPSDIQRFQAVDNDELKRLGFEDVVVMSVRGETPPAHYLAGGDYDGDDVLATWEPSILESFESSPLPTKELEDEVLSYFTSESQTVESVLHSDPKMCSDEETVVERIFKDYVSFDPPLGVVHNYWEKVIDVEGVKSKEAKIAAMCFAKLLDGRKNGWNLKKEVFSRMLSKHSLLPKPIWMQDGFVSQLMRSEDARYMNETVMRRLMEGRSALAQFYIQCYFMVDKAKRDAERGSTRNAIKLLDSTTNGVIPNGTVEELTGIDTDLLVPLEHVRAEMAYHSTYRKLVGPALDRARRSLERLCMDFNRKISDYGRVANANSNMSKIINAVDRREQNTEKTKRKEIYRFHIQLVEEFRQRYKDIKDQLTGVSVVHAINNNVIHNNGVGALYARKDSGIASSQESNSSSDDQAAMLTHPVWSTDAILASLCYEITIHTKRKRANEVAIADGTFCWKIPECRDALCFIKAKGAQGMKRPKAVTDEFWGLLRFDQRLSKARDNEL